MLPYDVVCANRLYTVSFSLNLYFQDEADLQYNKMYIRQGGDTMLSARIKAIFVLLLATIVIMAVTVKNTPPVSEYMQTGIRLSDLPDLERTEFMVAKGATAVPYNYKTSAGFQELTTDLVARYEENPYRILTGTYGSSSTNLYAEEVRKIVNDYYGIYHVEYYFDHYPEYPPYSPDSET